MADHSSLPPDSVGLLDIPEREKHVELGGMEPDSGRYAPGTFRKILLAIATVAMLVTATYLVPLLSFARPWTREDPVPFWNLVGREILGEGERAEQLTEQVFEAEAIARAVEHRDVEAAVADRAPVRTRTDGLPPYQGHPDDARLADVQVSIEDPSYTALDRFYAALARTDAGFESATTRVSHWGDSAIGNDGITSAIRRAMQRRFGDAGHGFHLLQPPNASYRHQNVRFSHNGNWGLCFIINRCRKDGHYGLGGVTFHSVGGAQTEISTARADSPVGRKVSRFQLWYAGQPRGGKIQIKVDGAVPEVIDTAADTLVDRWHEIRVADGEHRFEVRAIGGGQARAYGVVLERDGPGVVWDELSLIGSYSSRLASMNRDHFRSQLRHRGTDLVVLMFGGNDLGRHDLARNYASDYTPVLEMVRSGDDPPACLVMGPVDHGVRKGQRIETVPDLKLVIDIQRKLALEHGCAFFDTQQAMGGDGSMGRWYRSGLGSGDLAHLSAKGHRVVGELLYLALMKGYVEYRARTDR